MARPARFKFTKTDRGYLVNVTAKHSATGRREQRYFKTRDQASAFASDLREKAQEHGSQALAISPSLAEQATKAVELLKPFKVSLLDVVGAYVANELERQASVTVEEATASFKIAKEGMSEKHQTAIHYACRHLVEDFPGKLMSDISSKELAKHVSKRTSGPASFNTKRRKLVTLWNWAAADSRQWCKAKVAGNIEIAEAVTSEIGILSSKEAASIMKTAEKYFPECVPAFAIALFTGMRQAELERLKPEDITEDGVKVPASSAKTKRRRFIEMSSQLAAWLDAYPIGETVCPPNWRRKEIAVRRRAGWRVWSSLVEPNKPPKTLPEWPQNALRHTHATVALATGATLEDLTFSFGHTGGSAMLKQHYAGAITKREAVAIKRIGPNGKKLSNIQAA